MSKIFKYTALADNLVLEGYFPGFRTRLTNIDVNMPFSIVNGEFYEAGQIVATKVVNNKLTFGPIGEDTTADLVGGVIVRDATSQKLPVAFEYGKSQFIYGYGEGSNATVLQSGYITVPVQDDGTINANGKVYIRIKPNATKTYLPVGGIETAATTGETIEWTNARFTGVVSYPTKVQNDGSSATNLTTKVVEIKVRP